MLLYQSNLISFGAIDVQDIFVPINQVKLAIFVKNGTTIRTVIFRHVNAGTVRLGQKERRESKCLEPGLEKAIVVHFLKITARRINATWKILHKSLFNFTNLKADDVWRVPYQFV